MPMRFLIDATPRVDADIELDRERSHYLGKVLRHKAGDMVACFDGNGTAFDAQVIQAGSKKSVLRIVKVEPRAAPAPYSLALGLSLLKGQAMDRALQQATELGATRIHLLSAERSNVSLPAERAANKLSHWQKIVAGACEQAGHLYVPEVSYTRDISALLAGDQAQVVVLDMDGAPLPPQLGACNRLLLIGPEGGWSDGERTLFRSRDCACYRLTASTLRAETTPAVALALFQYLTK